MSQHVHQADLQATPREGGGKSARRRFLERATLAGIGFSLLVHLVISIIAALVTIDFDYADAGGTGDADVDFAILTEAELARTQSPEISYESFEVATLQTEAARVDLLSDHDSADSVSELADTIAPSLNPGGGSLTSIDTAAGSAGAGTGDGASFFGLEAQGRRFAYIVDISGSMRTLGPSGLTRWDQTRSELVRSIDALDEHAQFAIVLYSSNAIAVFGQGVWTDASRSNKRLAARTLQTFSPGGSTMPLEGFELVFQLDPECDAIYFMTDGVFGTDVPTRIKSMNRRDLIPIHTILFGVPANQRDAMAATNMMRLIARDSGGQFTHVREVKP